MMAEVVQLPQKRNGGDAPSISTEIFAWLNQVKVDRSIPASDFKIAFQLTQKTSSAEFERDRVLVTWQSRALLATEVGVSERTIHNAIKRMVGSCHIVLEAGHGPGQSNRYVLINNGQRPAPYNRQSEDNNRQRVAAYNRQSQVDNRQPVAAYTEVADANKRHSGVAKEANSGLKSGNLLPPNSSDNNFSNSAGADACAREDGAHRAVCGSPIPDPVLNWLRNKLGDGVLVSWFSDAVVISVVRGEVTLSTSTKLKRTKINTIYDADLVDAWRVVVPEVYRVVAVVGLPAT